MRCRFPGVSSNHRMISRNARAPSSPNKSCFQQAISAIGTRLLALTRRIIDSNAPGTRNKPSHLSPTARWANGSMARRR